MRATAGDISGVISYHVKHLEYVLPRKVYGEDYDKFARFPCDEFCQTALLSGEIESVEIHDQLREKTSEQSVTYSLQERTACPPAFAEGAAILAAVTDSMSRGSCIVGDTNYPADSELRITFQEMTSLPNNAPPNFPKETKKKVWQAAEKHDGKWQEIALHTEYTAYVLSAPSILTHANGRGHDFDLRAGWVRHPVVFNAISTIDFARRTLDLKLALVEKPFDDDIFAYVNRVLSVDTAVVIGPELMAPINKYFAENRSMSPADVALAERLLASPRVVDHIKLALALQRGGNISEPMLVSILRILKEPSKGQNAGFDRNQLAWTIVKAPVDMLRRHKGDLFKIASSTSHWSVSPLLVVLGEIDADAESLLRNRLDADDTTKSAALRGICQLNGRLEAATIERLFAFLHHYQKDARWGIDDLQFVIPILISQGYQVQTDEFLAQQKLEVVERLNESFRYANCK